MTTYSRQSLKQFFQTGDVPTGTDYANLIDSCANIVDTGDQTFGSTLVPVEVATSRVSAGNVNVTGTMTIAGQTSAVNINCATVSASTVYSTNGIFQPVGIASAAGTTQGTATVLTNIISRLQGVTDGSATGFAVPANITGKTLYILNETAASANLWPPVGGRFNTNGANVPNVIAAGTSYTIFAVTASAYGIK